MKLGKISESIWKSSVLKYAKQTWKKELGADGNSTCAFSACFDEDDAPFHGVVSSLSLPIPEDILMRHTIYAAINQIFADGYRLQGILLAITLPERMRQSKLSLMMQEAALLCESMDVPLLGGHTETSDSVHYPVLSVTALGKKWDAYKKLSPKANENYDLVVTKQIGLEAAALAAVRYEALLLERFPQMLLNEVKAYEKTLSIIPEAATAVKSGDCIMQPIREGGVFAALWNMAKRTGTGLIVDLKKIPVMQNAIEICNFFDLNPYESLSTGSLLIATQDGEKLVGELYNENIPATIIGKLQSGNDKIIQNGEETRFLDKPKPDQIRKILNQEALKQSREIDSDRKGE